MDHTSTAAVSAEQPSVETANAALPTTLGLTQIKQLLDDKDWASLGNALENGQVQIIPNALSEQIQQRNHDFAVFLDVQRQLFNVLYPLMRRPELLEAYLVKKDDKTILNTNLVGKELLGVELKASNLMKLIPLLSGLMKEGKSGVQKLYTESVLNQKLSRMYTVEHLKEEDFKAALPEYLGLALRYNMIPQKALDALVSIDLLTEAQKTAILSLTNTTEDGE